MAARSASRPIWEPEPSSPSANPRPPMIVSLPRTRAIAAEPVPAMISPPSAPAWAPMQAAVASFAARTRRKPGKAAATRAASLASLNPASPRPIAIAPDRSPEACLLQDLVDGRAAWRRRPRRNPHGYSPPRRSPRRALVHSRRAAARGSAWRRRRLRGKRRAGHAASLYSEGRASSLPRPPGARRPLWRA